MNTERHKKVISFSLYGNEPNYQIGAVLNVIEAKRLFPDWVCRFYTTDPPNIKRQLSYLDAEIIDMKDHQLAHAKMFWRFLAIDDPEVKTMICRDADSIVSTREQPVIDEWLNSEEEWEFNIIRDHPCHKRVPIPGGMWGYTFLNKSKNKVDFDEKSMVTYIKEDWIKRKRPVRNVQDDQKFLKWFYENVAKRTSILRYGPQGKRIPEHPPTRYTNHVGARTIKAGEKHTRHNVWHGFDKEYFNSRKWRFWNM